MACNCYEAVNKKLVEHNTKVAFYFILDYDKGGMPWPIETSQIEKGRGKKKAMGLFASFCPFCGVALKKAPAGDAP